MKILHYFLFISMQLTIAQSKDPDEIIKKIVTNYDQVKDYQVDANIKVDVEFIKVPETKAKIFFKQPDKVHLEADGFAMLPKNGIEFSPSSLFQKHYTAIYERDIDIDGIKTSVVKVIPIGDNGDVILSTLWIDQKKQVIRKVESTTKTNGTFTIDFSYENQSKYPLPSKMIFSFNIDKLNIPATITGETDTNNKTEKKKMNADPRTKGKVIIVYTNYQINKGIPDSIFEENNK